MDSLSFGSTRPFVPEATGKFRSARPNTLVKPLFSEAGHRVFPLPNPTLGTSQGMALMSAIGRYLRLNIIFPPRNNRIQVQVRE